MKITEFVGGNLKSFIAFVRRFVDGMGSTTTRIQIRCDYQAQARYLLSRCYGHGDVLCI